MATDLETSTSEGEVPVTRPSLKITGLHIKGLKSIASLDLPEDGLGWSGEIPDFVMIGGMNGSGKTTLLEFLVGILPTIRKDFSYKDFEAINSEIRAKEARIDLQFSLPEFNIKTLRFLIGNSKFVNDNANGETFGIEYGPLLGVSDWSEHRKVQISETSDLRSLMRMPSSVLNHLGCPSVVYFPSEKRSLSVPQGSFEFTGKSFDDFEFVQRFKADLDGPDPLVKRLYNLRWKDLSAKEEGRIYEANGFEAYSKAFNRFFEGRKRLAWHRAELVVETKSGAVHDLSELSSGEKQVILFMGELLHRWRPGSLILIDEPELHLHESYQTKLWEALVDWQKERGGQVIVATQSAHLFGISDPDIKVLLGGESLR